MLTLHVLKRRLHADIIYGACHHLITAYAEVAGRRQAHRADELDELRDDILALLELMVHLLANGTETGKE